MGLLTDNKSILNIEELGKPPSNLLLLFLVIEPEGPITPINSRHHQK